MLKDIVGATPLDGYRLLLRFEDGVEGEVDVSRLVTFDGVFAELHDLEMFRQVRVDAATGTIVWPGGADLAPDTLHDLITRRTTSVALSSPAPVRR